jgi:Uma2 family endonuclease
MIAVEILSPHEDTERKLTLYFAEGALEVWVLDVKHKSMTVYRRSGDQIVRLVVDAAYRSDAAQVTVSLGELFA